MAYFDLIPQISLVIPWSKKTASNVLCNMGPVLYTFGTKVWKVAAIGHELLFGLPFHNTIENKWSEIEWFVVVKVFWGWILQKTMCNGPEWPFFGGETSN